MATFILVTVAWVFSVCLHEYAHARVALAGGDRSVIDKGYLSMNPLRYTHPVLSIVMPIVFVALGGIPLPGGAVYIDHKRLRNKWWDSGVSLAGPMATIVTAAAFVLVYRMLPAGHKLGPPIAFLCLIEVASVFLNLLPIPPFDGFGIIRPHLPRSVQIKSDKVGRWALWALFIMLWAVEPTRQAFWEFMWDTLDSLGVSSNLAWKGFNAYRFWTHG